MNSELISRVISVFRAPSVQWSFRSEYEALLFTRKQLDETPRFDETQTQDAIHTLLKINQSPKDSGSFFLPNRGVLANSYLTALVNFLSRLTTSTTQFGITQKLQDELAHLTSQTVYLKLAEEVLLSLTSAESVPDTIQKRAAQQVIELWNDTEIGVREFCPLLESAWAARSATYPHFGSLLGASEMFSLVMQNCDDRILQYFCSDDAPANERASFEEFLFDMTFEELNFLRTQMAEQGKITVTRRWVEETLGRDVEPFTQFDPMVLYRSYYRRHFASDSRRLRGAPGPFHTAEGYFMIHLLQSESL